MYNRTADLTLPYDYGRSVVEDLSYKTPLGVTMATFLLSIGVNPPQLVPIEKSSVIMEVLERRNSS